jgi:hypothetical protein
MLTNPRALTPHLVKAEPSSVPDTDTRSAAVEPGQRDVPGEPAAPTDTRPPERESPQFDLVLRGYDRVEVDQYVRGLLEENAALRRDLETGRAAQRNGASAPRPRPSPTSRHYDVDTPAEDSFGFRAEKLLRLAEQEAAEMRTGATRDAESVQAAARRRAEEQLRAAEAQAEDIRARASQEAASTRKQASQETARLDRLYRSMKGELQRLAELLSTEAQRPDPDGEPAQADEPRSGRVTHT